MKSLRRFATGSLVVFSVVGVLGALRLRSRLAGLTRLEASPQAGDSTGSGDDSGWVLLTATGVEVDAETLDAAIAHAERGDLDVLDLIPGDLPAEAAMEFARECDPETFTSDLLARGVTARQATLTRAGLIERARISDTNELDPVSYTETSLTLKHYAPTSFGHVVAPTLSAAPSAQDPSETRGILDTLFSQASGEILWLPGVGILLVAAGTAVAPVLGAATLATWSLLPVVATRGTVLEPKSLATGVLKRFIDYPQRYIQGIRGPSAPRVSERLEALKPVYDELLSEGVERFFESRQDSCAWCGSSALSIVAVTPDYYQAKPGRFTLERCGECGHVFQNPRLTPEGLDFYYAEWYDGMGETTVDFLFAADGSAYRARAEIVADHHTPRRWLDIGTGHGHFPLVAAAQLPETEFDGLDMGASVEESERRGWIRTGHLGRLEDLAEELEGSYDVVSMHHQLEHGLDPRVSLAAASRIVAPGGVIEIEVPDPEDPNAQILGKYWLPYFQPQHLHLLPVANLTAELESLGFEIVAVQRSCVEISLDYLGATWLMWNHVAPPVDVPWGTGNQRLGRARRIATFPLAIPALMGAALLDLVVGIYLRRVDVGSSYRVVARQVDGDGSILNRRSGPPTRRVSEDAAGLLSADAGTGHQATQALPRETPGPAANS